MHTTKDLFYAQMFMVSISGFKQSWLYRRVECAGVFSEKLAWFWQRFMEIYANVEYVLQTCGMTELKFESQYLNVFHVFLHIVHSPTCPVVQLFCVLVSNSTRRTNERTNRQTCCTTCCRIVGVCPWVMMYNILSVRSSSRVWHYSVIKVMMEISIYD